jgi:ribosomal protein S18 acetylase RimI-like enzyme
MEKIIFKKATIKDIPVLIEIERKLIGLKTYSVQITEKEWEDALNKENEVVYFILRDGEVVGNISYEKKSGDTAYIDGFAIDPKFQKQGIGRETIRLLLEELKNMKRIELVTHPENTGALKIYLSFGFVIKERKENYFGDGEPRIELVKENIGK